MDDHHFPVRPAPPAWRRAMTDAFTRPVDLLRFLEIDPGLPALAASTLRDFAMRVPLSFARRMRKGDAQDPLFLQVWPSPHEADPDPGAALDAVGDLARLKSGGIIHKYHGRALLVATGACAVHCRYCFRRHFPYGEAMAARDSWREALAVIAGDTSIEEIILSGGDPLSLGDDKLALLLRDLDEIPHLRRLRIHTRLPVVLPQRVDGAMLDWLSATRLDKVVVLHANHAQEIDDEVRQAARSLRDAGALVLNQSVLLKGINDSVEALCDLSEALFSGGILPYYLHMLDRVRGAGHFAMDEAAAVDILRKAAARLPGYLVPRLVREDAGAPSKVLLS